MPDSPFHQSDEQRRASFAAVGVPLPDTNAPITTEALETTPTLTFAEPEPLAAASVPIIEDTPVEELETPVPTSANDLITQIEKEAADVSGFDREAEIAQRTQEEQKQLNEINLQIRQQQADELAAVEEARTRGETLGFASLEVQKERRLAAVQALRLAATGQFILGNLAAARQFAEKAVNEEFKQEERDIQLARNNILANFDSFSEAEKKRALSALSQLDAKDAFVLEQKAERETIFEISKSASLVGATNEEIQEILNANSKEEALSLSASFFGAKFRADQDEKEFDRTLKEANFNLSVEKFTEDIRQFDEKQALENYKISLARSEKSIADAEDKQKLDEAAAIKLEVLQSKLNLIKQIPTHRGLDSRVGPSVFGRGFLAVKDRFGAGQEFAGMVHQLVDQETLDTLVNIKARGATFGALQAAELEILKNSATKINNWEKKNKFGVPQGAWEIDEKSFRKEIAILQSLTQKAIERATGVKGLSPDEGSALDSFFSTEGTTPATFNPSNFF